MFEQLFKHMGTIKLTDADLKQVISFDTMGKQVTLGELVAQVAPSEVVGHFGLTPKAKRSIKPVHNLDDKEDEQIVDAYLKNIPTGRSLAVMGHGSYTVAELRQEVHNRTALGRRYMEIVKQHNMFLEEAARRGKIQKKTKGNVILPPFDF
jgi:hypothetical protein